MYSILVKNAGKNYVFHLGQDGKTFTGDEQETLEEVQKLLESYPLGSIVVVHNVTLTADLSLADVTNQNDSENP